MNLFGDPSGPEMTHFTFTERDRDLYHFMNDRHLCKFCSKFFSASGDPDSEWTYLIILSPCPSLCYLSLSLLKNERVILV